MGNFASNHEPHILVVVEKNSHWAAPNPVNHTLETSFQTDAPKRLNKKLSSECLIMGVLFEWWRGQRQTVTNCLDTGCACLT
jgi:hypothetical protein